MLNRVVNKGRDYLYTKGSQLIKIYNGFQAQIDLLRCLVPNTRIGTMEAADQALFSALAYLKTPFIRSTSQVTSISSSIVSNSPDSPLEPSRAPSGLKKPISSQSCSSKTHFHHCNKWSRPGSSSNNCRLCWSSGRSYYCSE